jgi:hypothetical protein
MALQIEAQQLAIGYFPFQNTLSISSNPERLFWIDGRIETNTFFGNLNPELLGLVNIKRTKYVNLYSGLSCKMNFIDGFNDQQFIGGYSINFGVRIKPFETISNLYFIFEIAPYVNREFSSGLLRTYWGISYKFDKKIKKHAPTGS